MNLGDKARQIWSRDRQLEQTVAQGEMLYKEFLHLWMQCWDEADLRELVDWSICLDLPMWIVCQSFERLLILTERDAQVLTEYATFVGLFVTPYEEDAVNLLRKEAEYRRSGDQKNAERIREELPEYRWGDRVLVKNNAPERLRPGEPAMIYVAATRIDTPEWAETVGGEVGEWCYNLSYRPLDCFEYVADWGWVAARHLKLVKTFRSYMD